MTLCEMMKRENKLIRPFFTISISYYGVPSLRQIQAIENIFDV